MSVGWQSKEVICDMCVSLCVLIAALVACFGPSFPFSSSSFLLVSLRLTDADSNLKRANIVKEASRGQKEMNGQRQNFIYIDTQ